MANEDDRKLVTLQAVAKKEPERTKDGPPKKKSHASGDKKKKVEDELSEEDQKIKENMELLVERMQDPDPGVAALALQTLSGELKAATSSMTSVPKPLKFLRPHIPILAAHYKTLASSDPIKADYAMVLAVLCTTCGDGKRRSLHFCLEADCKDLTSWGFEFLRNLAGEVAAAYAELQSGGDEQKKEAGREEEEEKTKDEEKKKEARKAAEEGEEKSLQQQQQQLRGEKRRDTKKTKKEEKKEEEKKQQQQNGELKHEEEVTMQDAAAGGGGAAAEEEKGEEKKKRETEGDSPSSSSSSNNNSSSGVLSVLEAEEKARAFRRWTPPLPTVEDLNKVVNLILPYYMTHNAEIEGVDLLAEVDRVEALVQYIDSNNYQKVNAYVLSLAQYAGSSEEYVRLLKVSFAVLLQQEEYFDALRVALRLAAVVGPASSSSYLSLPQQEDGEEGNKKEEKGEEEEEEDRVQQVLRRCSGKKLLLKQLALLLARQRYDCEFADEQLQRLNSGEELSRFFLLLAKETDVLEPKVPEEVYKTHLEDPPSGAASLALPATRRAATASGAGGGGTAAGGGGGAGAAAAAGTAGTAAAAAAAGPLLDSARQNLASTFVNAFVNAGFCKDKLMLAEGGAWLYKNKDHGMISAAASLGAILLWNVDEGLSHLDKYQYSSDCNIKAGALLGFGVLSSNVRHECDAAFALLKEHLEDSLEGGASSSTQQKVAAAIGLGCAYAGSKRQDVMEILTVLVVDGSLPIELSAFAAASLGLVFVGSCNQEAAEAILTTLIDRSAVEKGLDSPLCVYFALGLALLFLGTRDACEATLTALEALPSSAAAAWSSSSSSNGEDSSSSSSSDAKKQKQQLMSAQLLSLYAQRTVEGMAFAGSGDVLKVQKFLSICGETRDKKYWAELLMKSSSTVMSSSSASAAEGEEASQAEPNERSAEAAAAAAAPSDSAEQNGSSSSSRAADSEDEGGQHPTPDDDRRRDGTRSSSTPGRRDAAAAAAREGAAGRGSAAASAAAAATRGHHMEEDSEGEDDDGDEDEGSRKLDQAVAVMNVALLSFAEDVGAEMTLRVLEHILQYGELPQRRAVPLALALHSASRAKPGVIDTLSKLSHDIDADVALNAIFAMGIVGAGTNNARIAGLLRSLASYYGKDSSALFVVRLAQGLLYMGKGLLTINALHSDRFLINNVSLGCLCLIVHTCMQMHHTILGRFHYLLYYLFPAIHPRMLFTVAPSSVLPQAATAAADTDSSSSTDAGSSADAVGTTEEGQQKQEEEAAGVGDAPHRGGKEEKRKKDKAAVGGGAAAGTAAAGAAAASEEDAKAEAEKVEEERRLGEEELKMLCTPARVGEAVDIVGQVGRQPKTITAFQTHTTPVLLGYSERAELATDEYVPLATVLEGIVILKKNPNYKPPRLP